jgi:phage tail-like protein
MRGAVEGLASPHPLAEHLPALYQEEDPFARRLVSAFDPILAPIISILDNFDAYLDPSLAPRDFLDWLAGWLGIVVDETWSEDRCRTLVLRASDLYRSRGTTRGLREHIEIFTEGSVEVIEHGGVAWSQSPGAPLPGSAEPELLVRVTIDDPERVDVGRLDRLVAAAKPAHLPHQLELRAR